MVYNVSFPGLGLQFEVNPVALQLGGLTIRWYGVLIALGLVLALIYAMNVCKRRYGVSQDKLWTACSSELLQQLSGQGYIMLPLNGTCTARTL